MPLAALVAACAAPGVATGGVWSLEPSLATSLEYSTNPQLRVPIERDGYAAVAQVGLPFAWDGDAVRFEIAPRARLAESGGDSAIGANGYYLAAGARLETERSRLEANADWADDSTGIQQPAAGTLTRRDVPREAFRAGLDGTHRLSPRTELGWNAGYEREDYAPVRGSGLVDYRYLSAVGTAARALTERLRLEFLVGASDYEAPELDYRARSAFAQAGIAGAIDARWRYALRYGYSRVRFADDPGEPSGSVYGATLVRDGERATLELRLSQSIQPSGFGTLARAQEAFGRVGWRWSERLELYGSAQAADTRDAFGANVLADRQWRRVAAGGDWRATPEWTLGARVDWQSERRLGAIEASAFGAVASASRRFGRVDLR